MRSLALAVLLAAPASAAPSFELVRARYRAAVAEVLASPKSGGPAPGVAWRQPVWAARAPLCAHLSEDLRDALRPRGLAPELVWRTVAAEGNLPAYHAHLRDASAGEDAAVLVDPSWGQFFKPRAELRGLVFVGGADELRAEFRRLRGDLRPYDLGGSRPGAWFTDELVGRLYGLGR